MADRTHRVPDGPDEEAEAHVDVAEDGGRVLPPEDLGDGNTMRAGASPPMPDAHPSIGVRPRIPTPSSPGACRASGRRAASGIAAGTV